ncbi:Ca2+-dependent lipid-binding protein [Bradyrhizobium sp. LB1.3]
MPPEKIAELRVKQLEMIQNLVTRMAGYGASFKSYCITVCTAVLGFAFTLHRPSVAALALLPLITFALLDAQYLRVERRFRGLFDVVRQEGGKPSPPST